MSEMMNKTPTFYRVKKCKGELPAGFMKGQACSGYDISGTNLVNVSLSVLYSVNKKFLKEVTNLFRVGDKVTKGGRNYVIDHINQFGDIKLVRIHNGVECSLVTNKNVFFQNGFVLEDHLDK